MLNIILIGLLFLCHLSSALADTIYQWSDPWGQIQYSKKPVPGAMISDLTELPEQQETTEQQKQAAMVRKLNEIKQDNLRRAQTKTTQQNLKKQASLEAKNHCTKLYNLLNDIRLTNLSYFSVLGPPYFYGYYGFLEYEISREIQTHCR